MIDLFRDMDEAAKDILLDAPLKLRPDDVRGLSDDINRKVKAGKVAEAKLIMIDVLKTAKSEDRSQMIETYLVAMLHAEKMLEAYDSVPVDHARGAFRTLAEALDTADEEPLEYNPKRIKQLKELIPVHRQRVPIDPWLWYYEGILLQYSKDYQKAAEQFATGRAKLPAFKPDPGKPDLRDLEADSFRRQQVLCLYRAKRGIEAYEKIDSSHETFQQLAWLFDNDKDFVGLAALIAAHRKRTPNDIQNAYWQAHFSYRKEDYTTALPLYKQFIRETDDKALNSWMARDEYLRCMLRTKPADSSVLLAQLGFDKVGNALRAAVAAATDNRVELERLLAEATNNGGKVWFYLDDDFRKFIHQDKYRDLRAKYPDTTPPPKPDK